MLNRISLLTILLMLIASKDLHAQFGFSHEIGVIVGPTAFQSDFGERSDFETNSSNVGLEIGIVHYLNFSYRAECNCYTRYTYFNDHFKVRNELSFTSVDLEHFGRWVGPDKTSLTAQQLRAMKGKTVIFNVGTQLEFFPRSIRAFESGAFSFAPYAALGVQYNNFNPTVESELGPLGTPETTPEKYIDAFRNESGSTFSVVGSLGTRYKLTATSDLLFDLRWKYYFSNWVDGLNPDENRYPENRANDWEFFINVGYIYYLNF